MGKYADIAAESADEGRRLRELIPDTYAAHAKLHAAAISGPGDLGRGMRELVALAVAATRQCEGCIAAHARAAVRTGVTRQQVADAMAVVIQLNGGPGTVWAPKALAAFDEFADTAAAQ